METRKTKLALTASALAFALMLAGCGGGGSTSSAVTPSGGGGTPPQQEPEEQTGPVAVMMDMMLPAGLMPDDVDLPDSGMTVTVDIDKGGSKTLGANEDGQGGVVFMCESDYDCSLTLTNEAGTLVAEYSTKKEDADADNPMVTAMVIEIPEPTPEPMEVAGSISLTDEAKTWLLTNVGGDRLDTNGEEIEINLASGETKMYGSDAVGGTVSITCDSAYPCTVTLRNVLGELEATMVTMQDADADAPTVMAAFTPPPPVPDALARMNPASDMSVADILDHPVEDTTATTPDSPHGNASTSVGGLGLDGMGADNDSMLSLTSDLDPNTVTPHTPRVVTAVDGAIATPGAGGSEMDMSDLSTTFASSVSIGGWEQSVLFRDWGDTAGTGDGGFETGVLVYNNMEAPTSAAFDSELSDMFANAYVREWFDLTIDTDGDSTNDTVSIDPADAPSLAWIVPQQNISITVEGSQAAQTRINVGAVASGDRLTANAYRGTYFGAPGSFACIGTTNCVLERSDTGSANFGVPDINMGTDGLQSQGTWEFTPDPGAMVMVPDQDFIVFGAWLTTPDDMANGEHRVGVFHDGMQPYNYQTGAGLTGSADYSGGATGVYVDRTRDASGLFTARAMLTATFSGINANTLTGRIDDFKDTAGRYLGADTEAMPNDPEAGGENDWVVILGRSAITTTGAITGAAGTVSGSADGVRWTTGSTWTAQLYGPGNGDTTTPMQPPPSGVAGQFRAESGNATMDTFRGVVGSFGATLSEE